MARLVIHLLGRQEIRHARLGPIEMPDIYWPVLGCLLTVPGNRCRRSKLAGQLWPDQGEDAARHCLATALWRIRSKLPESEEHIVVTPEGVSLNPASKVWIDVAAFEHRAHEAAVAPKRLEDPRVRRRLGQALAHYKGDFLPDRTEEILEIERARLKALYLDTMYQLAMAEGRAGDWMQAVVTARALCDAEPLREDAQRLLIEALFRAGNRALALKQYDTCARILERELAVLPMSDTQALAASIRAQDGGAARASLGPALTGQGSRAAPHPHLQARPELPRAGGAPSRRRSAASREALLRAREHLLRSLALIEASLVD